MRLLNNEFIIKYFDTYSSKSNLYIVTELVTDGDLYEFISKNESFIKERQAASIMKMLFKCVDYLHSVGVIHRDLKPENILLVLSHDKSSVVSLKLIDFGLAKQIDSNTKCSEGCGTPGYMGTVAFLFSNTHNILGNEEAFGYLL
jgi:serine/threonine protein kinase